MSKGRESGEIVRPHVNRLQERSCCIDKAFWTKDPMHLSNAPLRIGHMLQDGDTYRHIEGAVAERQVVTINDCLNVRSKRHIGVNDPALWRAVISAA